MWQVPIEAGTYTDGPTAMLWQVPIEAGTYTDCPTAMLWQVILKTLSAKIISNC